MRLHDHTIAVLRGHGVQKTTKAFTYTVELVDIYLLRSQDLLMSQMFLEVAQRHSIRKTSLIRTLELFAQRIGRTDPEWYRSAFPHGYDALVYVETIAQEALASYRAFFQGM